MRTTASGFGFHEWVVEQLRDQTNEFLAAAWEREAARTQRARRKPSSHFAANLEKVRQERRLTVEGLAEVIDEEPNAIRQWIKERRIPHLKTKERIARKLGVALFTMEKPPKP